MKAFFYRFKWLTAISLILTLVGCAGSSAPTRFYMLAPVSPVSNSPMPAGANPAVRIGLDPVEVPEYLNRPQIVTHLDRAEYQLDEFNRWTEPLGDTLMRVIAENLSEMLRGEGIDILSMSRPVETDYTVAVQVLRMDGKIGRGVALVARWSLFNGKDDVLLLTRRTVIKEFVDDDTYQGLLRVQNGMVESLSRAIADGIRPIVSPGGGS